MSINMSEWLSSPYFGIAVSVAAFAVGVRIQKWLKTPLANPLLIAIALVISVLCLLNISYEDYNVGGEFITMLLPPATAILAISVYNQIDVLKQNFFPTLAGCLAGSVTAIFSILFLCRLFGLNDVLTNSLFSKSVTMPIAISLAEQQGGMTPVTVAAVIITGIFGAAFSPIMVKVFRVKDAVATGVAIGTCSHVGGTTTAIAMGEVQGAMSSIAIGVAGLITSALSLFV